MFLMQMEKQELLSVVQQAAAERSCSLVALELDDDNNIEVTIDREGGVSLDDCEYVHRAVLKAFDRDIEDYALTVGSAGIPAEEADAVLREE